MDRHSPPARRPIILLFAGTAIGIAAAAAGLLSAPAGSRRMPSDAMAQVNGAVIRREDYERQIAAAAQDRRTPLDDSLRRHILDRLIDEELLVQRGLHLGLADSDRKVRADLTTAVIGAVTEEYGETQPSDEDLRAFYEQNADFFAGPGRLRLQQVFIRVHSGSDPAAALERATQVAARLRAGEDISAVRSALGDTELAPVPDTLLPPAKLRDYIGPTALQTALGLDDGQISDPVRSSMGYHVLRLVGRQADTAPPLSEVKPQVLGEYRRRAGEQALRRYLDELRARADVEVAEVLP